MDEERVRLFAARLRPVLAADLPPDAAGSTALALALLAVQAEAEPATVPAVTATDLLLDQIQLLPAFIEAERDHGSTDDMPALVRRFVQGERPRPASTQAGIEASAAARRNARLRELRREGVDLSLIEATLAQSPLQRIANMERQLRVVHCLQRARRQQEAEP